ncbi:hypothetical protein [Rhodopseudomonas pseudopalustris]|uniref:Uncharacterized protein n=1 Tax=Rhodopseudomonas pseudopalustris TaxID=1513892 RepID=A0A1H8Q592_9BRAD|nr:hypothetical protein [Rhodopseudomonas pseudopalustris]MBB1092018.1 hypothetical protein [Rhodopseudomonas palustris]SEO49188.1 hypothetical protein SAMN05444123_10356 [Rhodopseudomonas pseudopalustris]
MPDFIRDENLKLYRAALAQSTDEEQRRVLLVLLRLLVVEQAETASRPKQFAPDPDEDY